MNNAIVSLGSGPTLSSADAPIRDAGAQPPIARPLPVMPESAASVPSDPEVTLCEALVDSRQRWRELVTLAADFAFETDAWGRFVLVAPDPALGWSAATLMGQPAELLLADAGGTSGVNPFRPTASIRRRRAWLRRPDGSSICLSFAVTPLLDAEGRIVGARGLGQDVTEQDGYDAQVAASLRRGELLDHIARRTRRVGDGAGRRGLRGHRHAR